LDSYDAILERLDSFRRHARGEPSWRDSVHQDATPPPLHRQRARERDERSLARVVGDGGHAASLTRHDARYRGDIDDAPALPAFKHIAPDTLRHDECA